MSVMKYFTKILFSILLAVPMIAMAGPLVNINKADKFEMERDLIGVTRETAQAIVEYRQEHGPFKSLDGVLNVEGVGRDFLNINRDYLHLGDDPRAKANS